MILNSVPFHLGLSAGICSFGNAVDRADSRFDRYKCRVATAVKPREGPVIASVEITQHEQRGGGGGGVMTRTQGLNKITLQKSGGCWFVPFCQN